MACVVGAGDDDDGERGADGGSGGGGAAEAGGAAAADDRITFLYKLAPGTSHKSFGINCARLARLPAAVLELARAKASEFEAAFEAGGGHTGARGGGGGGVGDAARALGARVRALLDDATLDEPALARALEELWTAAVATGV